MSQHRVTVSLLRAPCSQGCVPHSAAPEDLLVLQGRGEGVPSLLVTSPGCHIMQTAAVLTFSFFPFYP